MKTSNKSAADHHAAKRRWLNSHEEGYHKAMGNRQVQMIAIGGAIGTGLFYGSADAIKMAGPSVLLAYIIGGVAAYIIMRALGEMSVHNPAASSFSRYAQENLGGLAGYITGWTYCFEILIVAIADVTAFGIYMGVWFPTVPHWIWVLSVVLIICAVNLMSVKVFGELEFWFSFFKVATIIIMIVAGFILDTFIAGPLAKKFAFKIVTPGKDRPIAIILAISVFSIWFMCPMMSFIATILFNGGFNSQIFATFCELVVRNFPMAFFWQLFVAGPLVRFIFGKIFREN